VSDELDARRAYVLERIRGARRPGGAVASSGARTRAPLSFGQERLWFLEQLGEGAGDLNESFLVRLRGPLDRGALERAIAGVVRRHDVLRTRFVAEDGAPVQIVEPNATVELRTVTELREAGPRREEELEARVRALAAEPFALDRAPLMRAVLFELADDDTALLVVNHHIVSDGWSRANMLGELRELYRAERNGTPAALPPLAMQYADFAAAQRAAEGEGHDAAALAWWAERLRDAAPVELPQDFARPPVERHRGGRVERALPAALVARIGALARAERTTPFTVLLAAFVATLHRQSGQRDITVGVPVAGRDDAATAHLIGFFANTVALRFAPRPEMTLRELLHEARATSSAALAHAAVPFERIVRELNVPRDLSRAPIYQVMLAQQPDAGAFELDGGVTGEGITVDAGVSRLDFTVDVVTRGEALVLSAEYDSDLFTRATAELVLRRLERVLHAFAGDAERALGDLELADEDERRRLDAWSAGSRREPRCATVVAELELQAETTPDAVAVVAGEASVTWAELRRRAERLAARLAGEGVGRESRVGICLDRGIGMIVALWAVSRTGAAYVPIDVDYPLARIELILRDARLARIITTHHVAAGLLRDHVAICVTEDDAIGGAAYELPPGPAPESAAYVIYTSGSTGTPKGVVVEHRSVVRFFAAMDELLGAPRGRWLAMTGIAFDISVLELLWTLARGVTVVLIPDERKAPAPTAEPARDPAPRFGLFFFSGEVDAEPEDRYGLLLEAARFADDHGLAAIWVPERHFHPFGGLYPNPAVTAAALAAATRRVAIRAGSVVLPLHHPVRVAEDWAVVDNLSKGRAGLAFASGWHADDFVFAPDAFGDRFEVMLRAIDDVRALWRGEPLAVRNGAGREIEVRSQPRPYAGEPPLWLTSSHNPRTFETAGRLGFNVLTHLLGQTFEELEEKIALYRRARRAAGHDGPGEVSLMLHTFVGREGEDVGEQVRAPMKRYLATSLDLVGNLARSMGFGDQVDSLAEADREAVLDLAYARYVSGQSLIGDIAACADVVRRARDAGVTEIACLIDFGVPAGAVLAMLPNLRLLARELESPGSRATRDDAFALAMRDGVTHLQTTPSVARAIVATPAGRAALRNLEVLIVGGEALSPELAAQLRRLVPRVINVYGPTEATVWATSHEVRDGEAEIPIGRPLAHARAYVLDERLRRVPIGCTGELYLGGDAVAREYLDRPELTASRFTGDPFFGGRMYATGDRARWGTDGELRFLGRDDGQVKIRGFRIELGEVEHLVAQHPAVRACAARLWTSRSGDDRLVAYVTGRFGDAPDTAEIRRFILERAPSYLVPNIVVPLAALPLTPNGKLDRGALPPPLAAPERAARAVPSTELEREVARLWCEVLDVREPSVDDDFFDAGGHSLLAVQFVNRARGRFGGSLPLARFIANPTIAAVARELAGEGCTEPLAAGA
jgi:natural product biosynthesis luciferase-like monooxygenase protein